MIQFDEQTHTYIRNNNPYISVTTLLKKYNLSPDYTGIPADILAKAAARGNATHKDLENFIKQGTTCSNPDLINFSKYILTRGIDLSTAKSEEIIFNDTYLIAGTVDFQYTDGDEDIIADFKTTSSIHWEAVMWQLSIYAYMICKGDILQYYMKHLKVYHLYNGKLSVREVPMVDFDEVEKLLKANLNGDPYTYVPDISKIISDSEGVVLSTLMEEIKQCETLLKELNIKKEKMQAKIKTNMETVNQKTFTIGNLNITYIEESTRRSLDTDKVKALCTLHNVDINDMYKVSPIKSAIKIKEIKS
jgi:hypothetical protein